MTISVAIKPELEARLIARARTSGQSLECLIEGILGQEATAFDSLDARPLTGAETARAFRAWAKGFPASVVTRLAFSLCDRLTHRIEAIEEQTPAPRWVSRTLAARASMNEIEAWQL